MLPNKGKYDLKAMLHLAGLQGSDLAQVAQIALANQIPKKSLDQIFAELRRGGLVHSKKGKAGGYALSKPANEISAGDIIRILDGPIAPFSCANVSACWPCTDCPDAQHCAVSHVMIEWRNAVESVLDTRTPADMLSTRDGRAWAEFFSQGSGNHARRSVAKPMTCRQCLPKKNSLFPVAGV